MGTKSNSRGGWRPNTGRSRGAENTRRSLAVWLLVRGDLTAEKLSVVEAVLLIALLEYPDDSVVRRIATVGSRGSPSPREFRQRLVVLAAALGAPTAGAPQGGEAALEHAAGYADALRDFNKFRAAIKRTYSRRKEAWASAERLRADLIGSIGTGELNGRHPRVSFIFGAPQPNVGSFREKEVSFCRRCGCYPAGSECSVTDPACDPLADREIHPAAVVVRCAYCGVGFHPGDRMILPVERYHPVTLQAKRFGWACLRTSGGDDHLGRVLERHPFPRSWARRLSLVGVPADDP